MTQLFLDTTIFFCISFMTARCVPGNVINQANNSASYQKSETGFMHNVRIGKKKNCNCAHSDINEISTVQSRKQVEDSVNDRKCEAHSCPVYLSEPSVTNKCVNVA